MEKIIFRCKTCKVALTPPLRLLRDESKLGRVEDAPYVPEGYFAFVGDIYGAEASGHAVVNLADALDLGGHWESNRLIGCCGPDGTRGRNALCANDHEIGTEHSDCWQFHGLELDPDCVEMEKVETAENPRNV